LRYHLEQTLEESSVTDPLTSAKNRRGFTPLLEQEIRISKRSGQALAVLMLDIDHFKVVNDTYGHPTGDLVIVNLSESCFSIARNIDVVARLGGEEFAVMLNGCNQEQAVEVAERIRQRIEAQTITSLDGQNFNYTVSIGVAELNSTITNQKQLLSLADKALYQAKETGRNKVMVEERTTV